MNPPVTSFLIVFSLSLLPWSHTLLGQGPDTVFETWTEFDPRAEPLEVEIVREEIAEGIITRYMRYVVGTFAQKKTRVAAFYAFPKDQNGLPGIIQVHGGGQRARKEAVQYYAKRGYATIAINWGEMAID